LNDQYRDFEDNYDEDEEYELLSREKPSVEATIEALNKLANTEIPSTDVFYGLSGLTSDEIKRIEPAWTSLNTTERERIMQALSETSETNFEFDYRAMALYALNDPSAKVRTAAVDTLWEDETIEVMNRLINLTETDQAEAVRVAAASKLGRFILMGELGDFPQGEAEKAQNAVIRLLRDSQEEVTVRRRALEAISNCGHDIVPDEITKAYTSDDTQMQISAVYAMGRTCDPRWEDRIIDELDSGDAAMRYEAARASGELELTSAVPVLSRLVIDDDREVREAAIWALGEIGGREAKRVLGAALEAAEEQEEDDLIEVIEDAISTANLVGGDLFGTPDLSD
jgi:hypothetical protein